MSKTPNQLNYDNLQQAATWFVTLNDSQVAAQDKISWQHWLATSPSHQMAWQHVLSVNDKVYLV